MFHFQNLEVYKKAKQIHLDCKKIAESCTEKHVVDQLKRASFSIPLNIAEGSGKFSPLDRKNYFTIARASVFECVSILDILYSENKISKSDFISLMNHCEQVSKMLFRMISNLIHSQKK
jgi:four helix bundle protein